MSNSASILKIIYDALGNLNEELPESDRIALSPNTLLFGGESTIDSLSLVSVIVDVETEVGLKFNLPIALTDDRAMSRDVSPFTSVQSLSDYILELLAENKI